jgi:hypothetical protein
MKKSHDDFLKFHHIVCTTEISFDDEDLLLKSKVYNCPPILFIKGYFVKKMVNCILVDNDLTINIRPLKTMKEFEIPMKKLFLSHWMIQGFNQEGHNTMRKIRFIQMEDIESNSFSCHKCQNYLQHATWMIMDT